jgi:murein DD-endopeptidase MepM/ murein hydrolase activator NlpD
MIMIGKRKLAVMSGRALMILVVLAVTASLLPAPALAAPPAVTCVKNYVVAAGDTLSKIAYNNKLTVTELAAANNLKEPYTLQVGQNLCIPGTATTTTSSTTSSSKDPLLVITLEGNKIVLAAANYPVKNIYNVKAGEKGFTGKKMLRLGRVKASKEGAFNSTFLWPKSLRNSKIIEICLKNVETDEAICQRILNGKQPKR